MSQVAGVTLVFIASTCSSIGMNFQKLAHRQTEYHDPRLMQKPRNQPLNSNIYVRPYMMLGFILTAAAVICDAIALFFIGTTMIGVLGCMAQSLKDDLLENKPYVDIILGPDSYKRLPELLQRNEKDNESIVDTKLSRFEVYDNIFPKRNDGINAEIDELEAQINFF